MNQGFKGQKEHTGGSRNASLPTSGRSSFKEGERGVQGVSAASGQRYEIDSKSKWGKDQIFLGNSDESGFQRT
jgi:hypothetical protein